MPSSTVDTEAVTGQTGAAPAGTASKVTPKDTESVIGGSRTTEPGSPTYATTTDTSGAAGGATTPATSTAYSRTSDTTVGNSLGVAQVFAPYRAPSVGVPVTNRDTTLTDKQPGGSTTNPVPSSQNYSGTKDSYYIGAGIGILTGTVPAQPAAPTGISGNGQIVVVFAAVSDPANDKVLGYVVESDTHGSVYAPRNATSANFDNCVPDQPYKFRVAAFNASGTGRFSALSTLAYTPYNGEENDKTKPAGLTAANRVNRIYRPDGTVKPGTGGSPGAPGTPVATSTVSKTVHATWTAPTIGTAATGYTVTVYSAANAALGSVTVGNVLLADVPNISGSPVVTVKVYATNAVGNGEVSAASNAVTVLA
jgi:hypothetical protein